MASSSDLVVTMKLADKYLYQFACPIMMFIGTVSCIVNLVVFTQKTLRKNPCSIYFIAYNVANFLYIYSALLAVTLSIGYQMDASTYSLLICRLRLYTSILFNCLSPFYLVLASIDRILVTSPNALTRQRSSLRLAYTSIIGGTLFWVLFHSHELILTNIIQLGPSYFVCSFQPGVYFNFIRYYSLMKEIVAFSLMIICGLWAVKNVRSLRRVRAAPSLPVSRTVVEGGVNLTSSKDRQLMIMLLMETSIYGLFSFLLAMFSIYQQITQNDMKSADRMAIDNVIRDLCLFSISIPFCTSCYTNLIVSKTFRKEVKKVFAWKRLFCIE